jgi:elongation factor G
MLYYAGVLNQPGEVHDGNTVMDYLPQERERGITIRSAAISFNWDCKFQIVIIIKPISTILLILLDT